MGPKNSLKYVSKHKTETKNKAKIGKRMAQIDDESETSVDHDDEIANNDDAALDDDDDYGNDGDEDDFDNKDDNDSDDNNQDEFVTNDGLADMMHKILNQKVSTKNPVLAKRKTALMKEMEENFIQKVANKEARQQRKRKREKFLVLPNPLSGDFEKQMKKVATKGVVALFNAINSAKKEAEEGLQATTGDDEEEESKTLPPPPPIMTKIAHKKIKNLDVNSEHSSKQAPSIQSQISNKKWSVLKDDLVEGNKLSMKNWDKDSSDDNDDDDDINEEI